METPLTTIFTLIKHHITLMPIPYFPPHNNAWFPCPFPHDLGLHYRGFQLKEFSWRWPSEMNRLNSLGKISSCMHVYSIDWDMRGVVDMNTILVPFSLFLTVGYHVVLWQLEEEAHCYCNWNGNIKKESVVSTYKRGNLNS